MLRELRRDRRVLYIDPKGYEYNFGVACTRFEAIHDLTKKGGNFNIRVPTKQEETVTLICQHALAVGNCTVGVDEMQRFSDSYASIRGFYDILEDGGARAVSFTGTTHRPTDIENDLLAASDRIVVFQTTHSKDIDRLQHYIDAPDEVFIELSAPDDTDPMKVSEYLEWRTSWGKNFQIKIFDEGADVDSLRKDSKSRAKESAEQGASNRIETESEGKTSINN